MPQQNLPPRQETLPQHSVPQQTQDRLVIQYSTVLPPLPESRVSMLRQHARLHSLHLTEDAEEEAETVLSGGDEEEEGQGNIQVPAELRVCCCAVVSIFIFIFLQQA